MLIARPPGPEGDVGSMATRPGVFQHVERVAMVRTYCGRLAAIPPSVWFLAAIAARNELVERWIRLVRLLARTTTHCSLGNVPRGATGDSGLSNRAHHPVGEVVRAAGGMARTNCRR